jgi:hypothetical protein
MRILKISFFVAVISIVFPFCQKEHSLEGGIEKIAAGNWEFKEGNTQFVGIIESAYIEILAGNKKQIHLLGTSLNGPETFHLHLSALDSITTGTYAASLSQTDFQYKASAKTLYLADQLVGEFVVNITTLSNNHITGTFSGQVQDSLNNIKTLSEGKFSANINLGNNSGSGGTDAIGTLGTTAGSCTPYTISGIYTMGTPMDLSNNVLIQVTVTKAGNYTISTNMTNGIQFSSTGTFANIGPQNVLLTAVGIPVNAGNQVFTVTFGSGSCNFALNFATNSASLDYFPTTPNSNWTYNLEGGTPQDSIHTSVMSYTPTIAGNVYQGLNTNTVPPDAASDTEYYRKPGVDYYQFVDFSNILPYDNPVQGEYIFLKDNVPTGTLWQSPAFSGNITGIPIPVALTIKMTLLAKSVPASVGALNFSDVIKVKYEYFLSIDPTTAIGTEERWFARGVGLIHDELVSTLTSSSTYDIGRYTVY